MDIWRHRPYLRIKWYSLKVDRPWPSQLKIPQIHSLRLWWKKHREVWSNESRIHNLEQSVTYVKFCWNTNIIPPTLRSKICIKLLKKKARICPMKKRCSQSPPILGRTLLGQALRQRPPDEVGTFFWWMNICLLHQVHQVFKPFWLKLFCVT